MLEVQDFSQRGDAPALAIIQDNSRARALRQVVETQEELTRIHDRVTRTIDAYELTEKLTGHQLDEKEVERIAEDYIREQATLEFVDDTTQLLVILSDPVAKRKYQQQVAVFIVGFENLCGRRARLLAQLQEFFMQNGRGEDQFEVEPPEFDIEDVGVKVREALDKAEKATERLATVSKDVMKALELANPKETKKGKKKLEKTLQQSQQDIMSLTEKLIRVQNDLEDNEGKMSQMYKSLEMKQVEVERLKVQGENAKKAAETVKELKADLTMKDTEIQRANKSIQDLELSVAHLEDKQERDYERHKRVRDENQKSKDSYEEKIRDQQQYTADLRSELKRHYDEQVKDLVTTHQREMTQIQDDHRVEKTRMQKALDLARKKSEDLKVELSDSSKRSSIAESGSKRNSLFSPESADGESSPRKLSLKSSAQAVRFLNKSKMSDAGTSSEQSDGPTSPNLSKSGTTSVTPNTAEATQTESSSPKTTLSHKDSKIEKTKSNLKEKNLKGTPEKSRKSKSPEKPQAVVEPFDKAGAKRENSEKLNNTQQAAEESSLPEIQATSAVEMVDVGVQSDTDDFSDGETGAQLNSLSRRVSILQAVPEEEVEEDTELETLSKENLIEKLEEYKTKAQARQSKLENDLAELKNKYIVKTSSLKKQNEDSEKAYLKEKEELLKKIAEAEMLKEQAEKEAEHAVLQLEELLSEQEEMRQLSEKALRNRQEEQTMTGLSLHDRHEEQTMTSASLGNMREEQTMTSMSLGTDQDQMIETSNLEETGTEDQAVGRGLSPRDSGFEGAASSLRFDSRPSTSTVIVAPSKLEDDEKPASPAKPGMLTLPDRSTAMSARARRRLVNSALNDHPVAQETLRTYQAVLQFKSNMVQWLDSEGLTVEANMLKNVKPVTLNKEDNMQVIESMPHIRNNITQMLDQLGSILSSNHLQVGKPSSAVSTKSVGLVTSHQSVEDSSSRQEARPLTFKGVSQDATMMETNYVKLLKEYNDLAEGYERLQQHIDEETKFNQEQTSQNVALMTEMQETIDQLRSQLAELRATRSVSSGRTSSSIMFTRLDAERNGKILKRALNERRLSEDSFSAIMDNMSSYVSLPAKRLAHIVERYSHHRSMKNIEMNLKQSGSLNENVFSALEKMESLQNKRTQRWGDKMDEFANERQNLAEQLTASFQMIEQETGIFLIKPVYSLKGRREVNAGYVVTQRHKPPPLTDKPSSPATPAPTPWKTPISAGLYRDLTQSSIGRATSSINAVSQLENGTMKMSVTQPTEKQSLLSSSSGVAWQASRSHVSGTPPISVPITTPRILELDVNRMMIGQTDVSKDISPVDGNGDLPGSAVRHYVTVDRPSGSKQIRKAKQQRSGFDQSPPNTPYDSKPGHTVSAGTLSQYSPLPPIHMPRLRQESRSGKSFDSETLSRSAPTSPLSVAKIEQPRPSTQGTGDRTDAHLELFSPEILPVR